MNIIKRDEQIKTIAISQPRMADLMKQGKFELDKYNAVRQINWIKEYKAIKVKSFNEVFNSNTPSLASIRKYANEELAGAVIGTMIRDMCNFLNIGKNMNGDQIAMTAEMIMDDYSRLTIADFRLFFKRIMKGEYGQLYDRMDGQTIISSLKQFNEERMEKAQQRSMKEKEQREKPPQAHEINKEGIKTLLKNIEASGIIKPVYREYEGIQFDKDKVLCKYCNDLKVIMGHPCPQCTAK